MSTNFKTALITGASSGLGLALARKLLRDTQLRLILPVRNAQRAQDLRSDLSSAEVARIKTPIMDLMSLASVRFFVKSLQNELQQPIDIVMLNAGVQSAEEIILTMDGMEQTFAVNHLAHHVLLRGLESALSPAATVGWMGSDTHNPESALATKFGYMGAHYLMPSLLAKGQFSSSGRQINKDAYSTSKGLNIVSARHWARASENKYPQRRFFAFDPGLMPGTGLAREGNAGQRFGWKYILPIVARFMKGTSSTERSSSMLALMLLGQQSITNAGYFEYTGHQLQPYMPKNEIEYSETLFEFSDQFV